MVGLVAFLVVGTVLGGVGADFAPTTTFQPNLLFNYTLPDTYPGGMIRFLATAGSWNISGIPYNNNEQWADGDNSSHIAGPVDDPRLPNTVGVGVSWYGTAVFVTGSIEPPDQAHLFRGDPNSPYYVSANGPYILNMTANSTRQQEAAVYENIGTVPKIMRVRSATFTLAIKSDAPSFDQVPSTTYTFLDSNDRPIRDSPLWQLPDSAEADPVQWADTNREGQQKRYLKVPETTSVTINPPANTTFMVITGTMLSGIERLQGYDNPPFPGREHGDGKPIQFVNNLYEENPVQSYALWNTTIFVTALDPTVMYNFTLNQTRRAVSGNSGWDFWGLNDVSFYSAITPQPNDTASNVTDTPDPSATSANPNGANASIATPQRSLAGPIAGGVIGGIAALILLGLLGYFLRRRSQPTKNKQLFEVDEDVIVSRSGSLENTVTALNLNIPTVSSAALSPTASKSASKLQVALPAVDIKNLTGQSPSSASAPSPSFTSTGSSVMSLPPGAGAPTRPPPRPAPRVRQEEDVGLLRPIEEPLHDGEEEEVVPPMYNPRWGADAAAHGEL